MKERLEDISQELADIKNDSPTQAEEILPDFDDLVFGIAPEPNFPGQRKS